jgi:hypothetical protein
MAGSMSDKIQHLKGKPETGLNATVMEINWGQTVPIRRQNLKQRRIGGFRFKDQKVPPDPRSVRHNQTARRAIRRQLMRYCELDTASIVMVWKYWLS